VHVVPRIRAVYPRDWARPAFVDLSLPALLRAHLLGASVPSRAQTITWNCRGDPGPDTAMAPRRVKTHVATDRSRDLKSVRPGRFAMFADVCAKLNGGSGEEAKGVTVLDGSPYVVPDARGTRDDMADLRVQGAKLAERYSKVSARLADLGFGRRQQGLGEAGEIRAREIYESNAIEGVGTSFTRTRDILISPEARAVAQDLNREVLLGAIRRDRAMYDVLGLLGARSLSDMLLANEGLKALTEVDVRSIHALLTYGQSYSGEYRRYEVEINKMRHVPPRCEAVSAAMHELVGWIRSSEPQDTFIRSAALHAWLTHIHPFEDGNGRVARLLANMALADARLPPAIVKSASQRDQYIDALAISDEGGDILPLAGLFATAVSRTMREIESERFTRRLIRARIREREGGQYGWYIKELNAFLMSLRALLLPFGLVSSRFGEVGPDEFDMLRQRNSAGNTWLLRVEDGHRREVLLWAGYVSTEMRSKLRDDEIMPSIRLSVPADDAFRTLPYRAVRGGELSGIRELVLVPDVPAYVYMSSGGQVEKMNADNAAQRLADAIIGAFQRGTIPIRRG